MKRQIAGIKFGHCDVSLFLVNLGIEMANTSY